MKSEEISMAKLGESKAVSQLGQRLQELKLDSVNKLYKLCEYKGEELPQHYQHLIENILKERSHLVSTTFPLKNYPLQFDLIFSAAVVLSIEEGFRLDDKFQTFGYDVRALQALQFMSDARKGNGDYRIELYLPKFTNWSFPLIGTPMLENEFLLLNFLGVEKERIRYSTSLAIEYSQFVVSNNENALHLLKLRKLSAAIHPILCEVRRSVLNDSNYCFPDLVGLPEEIKRYLFKFLRSKDFVALSATNHHFYQFAKDEQVWKYFLKRDYKVDATLNAQTLYKARYASAPVTEPRTATFHDNGLHSSPSTASYVHLLYHDTPNQREEDGFSYWDF